MRPDILILREADLRAAVGLDQTVVEIVEKAFRILATEPVVMPPILSMDLPMTHGEVDVKTAYLPGLDSFAIKMSLGFYDNAKLGLPSLDGLMVLFSATTGAVEAVLLDNGYLTDIRTAAAGAVAAKYLAPEQVDTAAVIGTGLQASLQIEAAHLVRPFKRVLVWGRDAKKADALAEGLQTRLGVATDVELDGRKLTEQAQLLVTTTPAASPILQAAWLHPGLHITAMGSDAPGKNEIDPEALQRADLYVADRVSQCAALGELRAARHAGLMLNADPPELGEIIAGKKPGRLSNEAVTICDLTGTGAQDTAIATVARQLCADAGQGLTINN